MRETLSAVSTGLSEDAVRLLESVLGAKLPKGYRRYLVEKNGEIPSEEGVSFFDVVQGKADDTAIHHMMRVNSTENYDDLWTTHLLLRDRLGKHFLCIADDQFGNYFSLAISGRDYGKIFFVDHEQPTLPFSPDGSAPENFSLIAKNFDTFLAGLVPG